MVNKQYNINNPKLLKTNRIYPSVNNGEICSLPISPSKNQLTTNNINYLDTITEEKKVSIRKNVQHLHPQREQKPIYEMVQNCDELNSTEIMGSDNSITINDIGRFQYILQMDREMVSITYIII